MPFFFNQCLDKKRLKKLILWSLSFQGEYKTLQMIEDLKNLGFQYATSAGVSLSIDDLRIPPKKSTEVLDSEALVLQTVQGRAQGNRTVIEEIQTVVDTWHRTSETVKDHVIDFFEATNILNPVYMMAFSGARGNVSQVRQLVGMRGLMADPNGDIIGYAIRSNFREGLTLTEYMISAYGARKGVVDTALRTADAGYLTRRLVDVAQHIIVQQGSCGTQRGILLQPITDGGKVVLKVQDRLLGRVLARDLYIDGQKIASRNEAIDHGLAYDITNAPNSVKAPPGSRDETPLEVFVRSPLTCALSDGICQLCYGWSFTQNRLVQIGEAVGVIAGQSIGEPGTQLTMRTFHTGGVFTGEVQGEFRAPHGGVIHYPKPFPGVLVRTPYGQIAFLVKEAGSFVIHDEVRNKETVLEVPAHTALFLREGESVRGNQLLGLPGGLDGQGNDKIETRKLVFSDFDGEVVYQNVTRKNMPFPEKYSDKYRREEREEKERNKRPFIAKQRAEKYRLKKRYTLSARVGTLWVLAGQQLDLVSRNLPLFEGSGHLVEMNTLLSRHAFPTEAEGFICREKKSYTERGLSLPVLLPPQSKYQLDQKIDDRAIVQMIEPSHAFSADEAFIYQPRIHTSCAKSSFDGLKDTLAIESKNGEIFVIPDYTQQIGGQEKRHRLTYKNDNSLNPLRKTLYPWTKDLGWQNSDASRHLEIFYFGPRYRSQHEGARVWNHKLFTAASRQHGLFFVTPYFFHEINDQGSFGDIKFQVALQQKNKEGIRRKKADRLNEPTKLFNQTSFWVEAGETFAPGRNKILTETQASQAGLCTITCLKGSQQTNPAVRLGKPPTDSQNREGKNRLKNPREKDALFLQIGVQPQFPFDPHPQTLRQTIIEHQPGWFHLPGAHSQPPEFHGQRVLCQPVIMTMKCGEHGLRSPKTTQSLYDKIYRTTGSRKEHESVLPIGLLKNIRLLSLLRHPRMIHLLQKESGKIIERLAHTIIVSNPKNPWYGLFGTYKSWQIKKAQERLLKNKFEYVFDSVTGTRPKTMPRVHYLCGKKERLNSLSLGSLYQTVAEFSLDQIPHTLQRLENNSNFELSPIMTQKVLSKSIKVEDVSPDISVYGAFQAQYSDSADILLKVPVNKSAKNTFWSKQVPSRFIPNDGKSRVSIVPFLLPNGTYLKKDGFFCRFFIQFSPPLERGDQIGNWRLRWTPPWHPETAQLSEQTMTLSFVKRPLLHTKDEEVFHPPSTWLMYGEIFIRRRRSITKKGEVLKTASNECVLLEEKDKQTFAFSRPRSLSHLAIGDILRFGDEIEPGIGIPITGQVIYMTPNQVTIRKGQPILFYNLGSIHVKPNQCISKGHPLVTLSYQRLITGDIVQGIPKVEQLFEAQARDKETEVKLTRFLVKSFRRLQAKVPSKQAFDKSISMIQHKIIENIQKVYLSQGVSIADIHFELIIRRMTSWGKIRRVGHTGLFRHEILPLHRIEKVNAGTEGKKAIYEPVIVGISESALNAESFLSAASFQETSRVLARDAIEGKIDFLRGIKERVIAGDLIPAGTGFVEHIAYVPERPKDF